MFRKIFKNKLLLFATLVLIIIVGYFVYAKFVKKEDGVQYLTQKVEKGNIVVTVSGTGQIKAADQIDIKPKISGQILNINFKEGQFIYSGDILVQLDDSDAQKTVRDAEINLENAKLSLEKLKAQQEQIQRGDSLNKAYEDGMNLLISFFGEYSQILKNLENIIFGDELTEKNCDKPYLFNYDNCNISYYANYFLSDQKSSIPRQIVDLFSELENLYKKTENEFQIVQRGTGDERKSIIENTYGLILKTNQLIKIVKDTIRQFYDYLVLNPDIKHEKFNIIKNHLDNLNNFGLKIENYYQNLLLIKNTINSQLDILTSQPLDLRSQELLVKQRENVLNDAKEKLSDYKILAPFDGILTKINAKKGDNVSPSTVIASLITMQKIAEVFLNEIDAAKVKIGQKVILTFDALPNLTLPGKVYYIDPVGTESQGVVSYGVKISLDKDNDRVKPGMSVNVEIIINSKENVLLIPNSAIKSQRNDYFVEVMINSEIQRQKIEIGISNDEVSEVISGLKEGDVIIMGTISTGQVNNQRRNLFQFLGSGNQRIPNAGSQFRLR